VRRSSLMGSSPTSLLTPAQATKSLALQLGEIAQHHPPA
jgi:hypothetical protein